MIHPAKVTPERSRFLLGLVGAGIQASRTPPMHEREGGEQGFRLSYQTIDLERLGIGPEALPELLVSAERMGFRRIEYYAPVQAGYHPAS